MPILMFSRKICCQVLQTWKTWRNITLGVFCCFSKIFIPNMPWFMICSRFFSYQSKLLVVSTHPESSNFSNQKSHQVGRQQAAIYGEISHFFLVNINSVVQTEIFRARNLEKEALLVLPVVVQGRWEVARGEQPAGLCVRSG